MFFIQQQVRLRAVGGWFQCADAIIRFPCVNAGKVGALDKQDNWYGKKCRNIAKKRTKWYNRSVDAL